MPENNNGLSGDMFENSDSQEVEKLKKRTDILLKKISGENLETVTLDDLLHFMRVINFNFVALTKLIQAIYLKNAMIDSAITNMESGLAQVQKQLQQFFDDSSMIDDILKGESNSDGNISPESQEPGV
jgi:hypothetical protein